MRQRLGQIGAAVPFRALRGVRRKTPSGLNTADQNSIGQRWLNGNDSVFAGAGARTGGRLNR